MESESGNMFGLMVIQVDNNRSSNVASWAVFDSLEQDDFEGFEENFPVEGFRVISAETPANLTVSDFSNFEWEGDELLFNCKANWKIEADSGDIEAWGNAFQKLWSDSYVNLEHDSHPGLIFFGNFKDAPEYS